MVNPKDFQATPWSHKAKVDKSGPNKNLSAHGRPNMVPATPMDHFKPVPHSGEGHKALGQKSHEGIGNPYAVSSDRSEAPIAAKAGKVEKSKPTVPSDAKKWSKKGYNMTVPATDSEGMAIAKKMKAH